jgi:nucleotide-binding universal stress UspA family protein
MTQALATSVLPEATQDCDAVCRAQPPFIVVGVDDSESSRAALRWAAEHAVRVGCRLHVVTAWLWPVSTRRQVPADHADLAFDAEWTSNAVAVGVLGQCLDVVESIEVVQGDPAAVLVERSRDAALLVVGGHVDDRSTGASARSVSQDCARGAHCPVVVVLEPESLVTG